MIDQQFPYREEDYTVEIVAEALSDGSIIYVARYAELDGAMAHGETEQEARENLSEAFEMVTEHLLEFHLPIPAPQHQAVQQVVLQSYPFAAQPPARITVTGGTQSLSFSQVAASVPTEWLKNNVYFHAHVPSMTIDQSGKPVALAEAG